MLANYAHQYLTFLVNGEVFALPVQRICEIELGYRPVIAKGTPAFAHGVVRYQNMLIPSLSLAVYFGHFRAATTPQTCTVIADLPDDDGSLVVALPVDRVISIFHIPPALKQPSAAVAGASGLIAGTARVNGQIATLLNVDYLLTAEQRYTIAQFQASAV